MNSTLKEGLSALLVGVIFYGILIINGLWLQGKWIEYAQQARQEYATKRQQILQDVFSKPSKDIQEYYNQLEQVRK